MVWIRIWIQKDPNIIFMSLHASILDEFVISFLKVIYFKIFLSRDTDPDPHFFAVRIRNLTWNADPDLDPGVKLGYFKPLGTYNI